MPGLGLLTAEACGLACDGFLCCGVGCCRKLFTRDLKLQQGLMTNQ
jgi:hypothetical protein